ncbi:hypothetical protein BpHYR1_029934 [Brachionus plicatilis]|uniref:Uncharacterized protein n=1 Tax=Brachionus plicatilis TaxID=10195 RepID=A0A3M7QJH6_BRAPC|nr:hypothetical protein BpHYR1_029934 [Brachionus plicatilis]
MVIISKSLKDYEIIKILLQKINHEIFQAAFIRLLYHCFDVFYSDRLKDFNQSEVIIIQYRRKIV